MIVKNKYQKVPHYLLNGNRATSTISHLLPFSANRRALNNTNRPLVAVYIVLKCSTINSMCFERHLLSLISYRLLRWYSAAVHDQYPQNKSIQDRQKSCVSSRTREIPSYTEQPACIRRSDRVDKSPS